MEKEKRFLGLPYPHPWMNETPTATMHGLDRLGVIQDLADFAEVLQPSLEDMTADRLCRRVERYAGAANA